MATVSFLRSTREDLSRAKVILRVNVMYRQILHRSFIPRFMLAMAHKSVFQMYSYSPCFVLLLIHIRSPGPTTTLSSVRTVTPPRYSIHLGSAGPTTSPFSFFFLCSAGASSAFFRRRLFFFFHCWPPFAPEVSSHSAPHSASREDESKLCVAAKYQISRFQGPGKFIFDSPNRNSVPPASMRICSFESMCFILVHIFAIL